LGELFNRNQTLLTHLGVSSPHLDRLVAVACAAGALGAKLSGGGRGGNMIVLIDPTQAQEVTEALQHAGARSVLVTTVS
jgi:mevalonate kinase